MLGVRQASQFAVRVPPPITARPVLHKMTVYDGVQQVIAVRYELRGRDPDYLTGVIELMRGHAHTVAHWSATLDTGCPMAITPT